MAKAPIVGSNSTGENGPAPIATREVGAQAPAPGSNQVAFRIQGRRTARAPVTAARRRLAGFQPFLSLGTPVRPVELVPRGSEEKSGRGTYLETAPAHEGIAKGCDKTRPFPTSRPCGTAPL